MPIQAKKFKDYPELVSLMQERGMVINDAKRAERKIAQVGYYHLSGYSYSCRKYKWEDQEKILFNDFQSGTNFEQLFKLYLMDKKLRIELGNALERIEIYLRTIIAHELGRNDPLAHLSPKSYQKSALRPDSEICFDDLIERHDRLIERSREDCITHHLEHDKEIPIWVASEAWDFGFISRMFSILKGKHQKSICARIGMNNDDDESCEIVENWLINLNVIRNRCAHHSRIFNRANARCLKTPKKGYFNLLQLDEHAKNRLYGVIAVIWFLLEKIGPNSMWICRIADIIDSLPTLPGIWAYSMGFERDTYGFPRYKFDKLKPNTIIPSSSVEQANNSFKLFSDSIDNLQNITEEQKKALTPLVDAIEDIYIKLDEKIK